AAAVCRLQAAKGRDWQTPPPVLIADLEDLNGLAAAVPPAARRLAAACWPGPLTLVFDLAPQAGLGLGDGAATVAVRLPDCEPLRRLLRRVGPLAVSSANRHGRRPATTAAEALSELGGRVALCVDGGPTPGPVPSSIVSFAAGAGGRLLRWGRLGPAFLRRFAPGLDSSAAVSPAAASGSETAD
ncbi:MAG: Sua5/YciO/YrdC/YwlC family protein, partial [Propionibacteriaceae bacterium]|nr:Sua5/YciO/YrdC/YwlC family protein [Propionibacteriaceae bacterium]